jgi:peroxiredoxin
MKKILMQLAGLALSMGGFSQQHCTVQVTTKNITDGTWFYLQDSETNYVYDSAQAKGNTFTLHATLDKEATQALVYEKKYEAYIFVWLAPGRLHVVQQGKTLRTAKVAGNELEAHSNELKKLMAPIEHKIEQLEVKIEKERSETKRLTLIKEYEVLQEKSAQTERDYVRKYPERLYSAYLLDIYDKTWGVDTVRVLFGAFSEDQKNTGYGKKIQRYLLLAAPSEIGDIAAEVKQPTPSGDSLRLSSFKGKWVLLEFWASWCGPCREENPSLVKTYGDFTGRNFEIFAVSLDKNGEQWKKAIQQDNLPWLHVSELNGSENSAALTYSVNGIPDNVLITPQGKIVARGLRGKALREFLEENLKNY